MFAQLARDIARRGDDPRVRLEADTSGGQLHLRATVVDDDGRTESFRRLKVRVGGPEGFRQEVALEAVGAGSYAAIVPLSQPGAYIATAVDEIGGEPVATTGAVLSTGEELRPTGSDRALLTRIANMTGGKMRPTLAGIFKDRVAKRFSYRDLTNWLMALGAIGLLLSVGSRRFAFPESLTRWYSRRRRRKKERRAEPTPPPATQTAERLLEKKSARAEHAPRRHGPVPAAPAGPGVPAQRAAPIGDAPPRSVPRVATRRPARRAARASPKKLSAAEILLARRKGKPKG